MAGKPWEKYAQSVPGKPWEKYGAPKAVEPTQVNAAAGAFGRSVNVPNVQPSDLDKIKSAMVNYAPAIGATAGEIALGPLGLYGGAALGSAIKQSQHMPDSVGEGAKELGKDLAFNAVIPQGVGLAIRSGLKAVGPKIYQSAFEKLNALSAQKNKMPIGQVLWNKGITGTDAAVGKQAVDLLPGYNATRNQILQTIEDEGIKGDLRGAVSKGSDYAQKLANSRIPEEQAAGKQLLTDIEEKYAPLFASKGSQYTPGVEALSAQELQKLKSLSSQGLSPEAFAKFSPATRDAVTQGDKLIGGGLKGELENMASQVSPELATNLASNNAEQSSLIAAAKKLNSNALASYNKKLVTPVDAITYTLGHATDTAGTHQGGLTGLALKKAADLYKTTWGRTNLGKGLYDLGMSDPSLVNTGVRAVISPWNMINDQYKQGDE